MNSLKCHMRRHPQEHQAVQLMEQYKYVTVLIWQKAVIVVIFFIIFFFYDTKQSSGSILVPPRFILCSSDFFFERERKRFDVALPGEVYAS